jgi:hypothetical protein
MRKPSNPAQRIMLFSWKGGWPFATLPRRPVRLAIFAFVLACAASWPSSESWAQQPDDVVDSELAESERLLAGLDFRGAASSFDRVAKLGGMSREQLVRVYRGQGTAHAALGHSTAARDAFMKLLAIDPDFHVDPNMSPRTKAPYFEARGFWTAQSVRPGLETSVAMNGNVPARITVTLRDPTHLTAHVITGYRWETGAEFTVKASSAESTSVVPIPPPARPVPALEFFVQALDGSDNVLFEKGSPETPQVTAVNAPPRKEPAPPPRSGEGEKSKTVFQSPVFWAIAGAVVVGAGATVFFATRSSEASPATMQQLTPAIACGGRPCP